MTAVVESNRSKLVAAHESHGAKSSQDAERELEMGRSLRIAFLTPEFVTEPVYDGGLANYLNRVTAALREVGHIPEVLVLSDRDETIDHDGLTVHRVPVQSSRTRSLLYRLLKRSTGVKVHASLSARNGARSLASALLRRHEQQPYDLVQGSDYGATGLYIPRRRNFPFVTRLSYYRPWWREAGGQDASVDRLWAERMERNSVQRSDACYGPSHRIAEQVRRVMRVPVEVIRPPVPPADETTVEDDSIWRSAIGDKRYVLFFGRVCRLKGVDLLAEAMRPILEADSSLHLVIVGREAPTGIVDEMRVTLGSSADRLIHRERLPHTQLFPVIRHAKAVALPSRIDNFPNVCIEAMRLGQVVVGTREASFDELITDGLNGFLASRESVASLVEAIRRALKLNPDQRKQFAEAASATISEFSPEITIPALCDFYQRTLQKPLHRLR
jgi:glycogen synthase